MNKNLLALLAISCLLFSLSGCAGAVIPCSDNGANFNPNDPQSICCPGLRANYETEICEMQVADWVQVSLAALVLVFMIVALIMGFAFALNFRELFAWGKNELFQVLATAIIIGAAFAVVNASDILSGLMLSGITHSVLNDSEHPTAFSVAEGYLDVSRNLLLGEYLFFSRLNMGFGQWASMTLSLMPSRVGFRFQPAVVLRPIMDANGMLLNALGIGLAGLYGQMALIGFIKEKMLALFLPIGIVLRSFPFTRSRGSAMIAIALGFYIVFPLTYYLSIQVLVNHCAILNWSDLGQCSLHAAGATFRALYEDITNSPSRGMWEGFGAVVFWMFMWSSKSVFIFLPIVFSLAPEVLWFLIILGFIMPFISLVITLTFTRELAKILGGDVNISALTRII
ncbi:hypothetical protein HY992_00440 [Candidatus Micrarchaeota archaeon]|nr:hypothetical protein [Candidatus Micrarchaeota archaeon]